MTETVVVTPAQVSAARAVIKWSESVGREVPSATRRIANARPVAVEQPARPRSVVLLDGNVLLVRREEMISADAVRSQALSMREQILLDQDYVGERRDAVLEQLEQLATTVADEVETSTGSARLAIYYGATPSSNDLYKLKGIGPKHTEVLESIGVDSIKELSHRSPASLTQMILDRHGRVIGVSEKQVAAWVDEAKSQQR